MNTFFGDQHFRNTFFNSNVKIFFGNQVFLSAFFHIFLISEGNLNNYKKDLLTKLLTKVIFNDEGLQMLPHEAPLKSPYLFCIKLFFDSFLLMLHPDGLLFLSATNFYWNAFTVRLVTPSPVISRLPLFHFFFMWRLYLPYESS